MRSLPATLTAFLLLLMLSVTTPMGTGQGLHEAQLLHPLFSHVHQIGGRIVTHEQLARQPSSPITTTPAIASGSASEAVSDALVISPNLPLPPSAAFGSARASYTNLDAQFPTGRIESPPDPPPTRDRFA
jgi:hypothetical protein